MKRLQAYISLQNPCSFQRIPFHRNTPEERFAESAVSIILKTLLQLKSQHSDKSSLNEVRFSKY